MASFSAGTTFTDGVANDVTAAKLGALVNNATPTSGLIQDRTAETVTATNDTLLIGDASDSNNLKRITVANFAQTLPTAKVTTGTIETGTFGTTTSTAATITTGTIPTLVATTLVTTGAGTAASPAIVPTGDTNTGIFFPAADTIAFSEGGTESVRIDSSGNVGIGNTVASTIISAAGGANGSLVVGTGSGVPNVILYGGASNYGSLYFADGTTGGDTFRGYVEYNHTDNFLRFGTNTNERLRIDSSGNVGIGTTSPTNNIGWTTLALNSSTNGGLLELQKNGTRTFLLFNPSGSSDTTIQAETSNNLRLGAGGTERLRITSGGFFKASVSGLYQNAGAYHEIGTNNSNNYTIYLSHSGAIPYGIYQNWINDPNNLTSTFFECRGNNTLRMVIYSNGNIQNTNNSYGAISDVKLKENITDASSQWNDIKTLQVRKFSFKDDKDHKLMIGLVAQEVELVSPNLVETTNDKDSDGNDLGTTTKGVKYSVLYMKAVKALQEAMERIEQLEAKVTALEAA